YHFDSVNGGHDSAPIFSALHWFLQRSTTGHVSAQAYALISKPRQLNTVYCDIYMLHYIGRVKVFIETERPESLLPAIYTLVKGSFNINKADQAPSTLFRQLSRTA
ncbi:Cysteine protease, partial [Phytophthora megakarya]